MDPFDDILPVAPAARNRPGSKFMPKGKSKPQPRKEISASENADGISQNECHNAVASRPLVEVPTLKVASNSEMGDSAALADDLPSILDSNEHLEPVDNSLQVGPEMGFKSASDDKVAIFESNIVSNFSFGREQEVVGAEFELDPFSNNLPDPGARNAHKFQPKIKPRPRAGIKPAISSPSSSVMIEKSVELPTSCTNEVESFQSGGVDDGRLNQSTSLPLPTSVSPSATDLANKVDYMNSSIPFSEDNRSFGAVIPSQLDSPNAMHSEAAVHNGTRDFLPSFGKPSGEDGDIFTGLESLGSYLTQAATDTGKPAVHSFNEKGGKENFVIPACSSSNSHGVSDTTRVQRCPEYHTTEDSLTFNEAAVLNEDDTHIDNSRSETEEVLGLNSACEVDDMIDYQPVKAGTDPTSEVPVHEELTNAADSPTLADFLNAGDNGENKDANERKKDSTMASSLRKHKRSSITSEEDKGGKTTRKLRKLTARKPANNSLNENVEDDDDNLDPPYNPGRDEHEENDDECEVDFLSKKKRASTNSKKESVAKNGKKSRKRKNDDDDLEKTTKKPPKKFSHSTRRRKRCVDKALLEIPEDELDPRTLPIKDIILLAEHRERLAKKDPTTSGTPFTNQSGGDAFHEAGAFHEEEMFGGFNEEGMFGSEDGGDPDDNQADETVPLAPSLFNYQSFMDKTPRVKWSNQDTELFYEAVRQFGTDFSMIQQLFPDRTRHQIKLKYKKEERQHPLRLSDAVNSRSEDHSHFKLVIERLQQLSAKAQQDNPLKDLPSDVMTGEEFEDVAPGTNQEEEEEVKTTNQEKESETTKEDAGVKDQEDSAAHHSPEQDDYNSDDDMEIWAQYKSDY